MQNELETYLSNENFRKKIKEVAKGDLHNHASNGGAISFLNKRYNKNIIARSEPFQSIEELEDWITKNISRKFPGIVGYYQRITSAFIQCHEDCIKELCMSFTLEEIKLWGDINRFIIFINTLKEKYLHNVFFIPELSLKWDCDVNKEMDWIEQIINRSDWFHSIDICGKEEAKNARNFKGVFRKAKDKGFKLRAHVGEFGTCSDIMYVVENLELDEVNHGISICDDVGAVRFCVDNKIRFNVCPSSNIMMGRVTSYVDHPIAEMFHKGLKVTINSDDCLAFNRSVSEEYVNLYCAGTLKVHELEVIRNYSLENYIKSLNKKRRNEDYDI